MHLKKLHIVTALVACAAAGILGACSSGALQANPMAAPAIPASLANTGDAPQTVISFNPASPLQLALNTTVIVNVMETGYNGPFKVVGCSAKLPVHCTRVRYGMVCYENYTPNDLNSISATIYAGSTKMTMANYAVGTYFPVITCRFKIKDTHANTATYTATSP